LRSWSTCLTSTLCWSSHSVYSRTRDTCSDPFAQTTWSISRNDRTRLWPHPCGGSVPHQPRHLPWLYTMPYRPPSQTRRTRHPVFQDMRPFPLCPRFRGRHPHFTSPRPGHRHNQPNSSFAARTVPGSVPSDQRLTSRVLRPAERQIGHRSVFSAPKEMAFGYTLLPGAQAHRFRGLGGSARTDPPPWGHDSLQALWGMKPTRRQRYMRSGELPGPWLGVNRPNALS
jgi:hypothetical protein